MCDNILGIVIDAGSLNMKAGFAGEPSPRVVFPSAVGRSKVDVACATKRIHFWMYFQISGQFINIDATEYSTASRQLALYGFRLPGLIDGFPSIYCGREAIKNRGFSNIIWPVQEGMVKDWDEMEKLWHHVFYKELHEPPEHSRVLHAVHPLLSIQDKEKMTEIFFESFAVHDFYIAKSPTLVLYASGRTSGIVWENGYACSYVAPVFEGFHLEHSTRVSPLTGKLLTERLQTLLLELGYSFTTPSDLDQLNKIKEDICYVAQDYDIEIASTAGYDDKKVKYTLPDGQNIFVREERFQVAEVMLKPKLGGYKCKNIIDTIIASIESSDIDNRKMFFNNIVLSGGSSLFPGLADRLLKDLTLEIKPKLSFTPNLDAMAFRQFSAWTGGSIMASMTGLNSFWMTKQQYEDSGSERVKYNFF